MSKNLRNRRYVIVFALVILVTGYVIAELILSAKIENYIKTDLSKQLAIDYQSLNLSLWKGQITLEDVKVQKTENLDAKVGFDVVLEKLSVSGFSAWKFLSKDEISVDKILLDTPKIIYNLGSEEKSVASNDDPVQLDKPISVKLLSIDNAQITMYKGMADSLFFKSEALYFELNDIHVNNQTIQNKIPFNYDNFKLSVGPLFYRLSEFEDLKLTKIESSPSGTTFEDISILTKYSKNELQRHIKVERDHFKIEIPKLHLKEQQFGFLEDSILYFKSPEVKMESPIMEIYRDKLTADDPVHKKLYSKMLRDLKIHLSLDHVILDNTTIVYSEKVNEDMPAGRLFFDNLNGSIKNMGNTYDSKVNIEIDAIFMKQTPINVHWTFDVHNLNDHFVFKANIDKLPATNMNPFMEPNLKVKLEGEVLKTYFTIDGNHTQGNIDFKIDYEDFKIDVLKKDGRHKNKLLSAVANIFIKKNSETSESEFREVTKKDIERDPTKSVFNFLWLNIQAALLAVMTG